jgi:hypothetical protein
MYQPEVDFLGTHVVVLPWGVDSNASHGIQTWRPEKSTPRRDTRVPEIELQYQAKGLVLLQTKNAVNLYFLERCCFRF